MSRQAYSIREDTLKIDGLGEMYFREYTPDKPSSLTPLLCLPGFWRNSSDYRRIAGRLAADRRIVTPDLRGRGKSSRSANVADYHIDRLVGDVWALVDHLGIDRMVVIGVALGGFMAFEMASARPGRIAGIVLNDVGTETSSPGSKSIASHLSFDPMPLDEVLAKARKQYGDYFPDFGDEDWKTFALQAYRETSNGLYVRDFDELTQQETQRLKDEKPSYWAEFMALEIPVAVMRGEQSQYMPAELAQRMAHANPHATLTTIPDRGHPPVMDEPAALAAIGAVLAEADKARPS